MHQLPLAVGRDRLHERIGHRNREIEVAQVAAILGVNERFDVGMITAQHPHLRSAAGTRRLDGFAGLVEHAHVGERPAGTAVGAPDVCALRPDAREVIPHAAAAPHGLGGLVERGVDADLVAVVGDAVAYRLHKAVDQGGLELGAGGGIDATAENEPVVLGAVEGFLPRRALLRPFDRRQRTRHPAPNVIDGALVALGILFEKNLLGDCLGREAQPRRVVLRRLHSFSFIGYPVA